ncbi:MAG TPA: hypothetical protein VGF77_00405 [Allosphingosinicella sp.]|jgi:hypothetical protein
MSLHSLFGRHLPDHAVSRWDRGYFVTRCTVCHAIMIKLPGLAWKVR